MKVITPYGTLEVSAQEAIEIVKALIKDAPQDVVSGLAAIPETIVDLILAKVGKP